jgi:hypothetical protein
VRRGNKSRKKERSFGHVADLNPRRRRKRRK